MRNVVVSADAWDFEGPAFSFGPSWCGNDGGGKEREGQERLEDMHGDVLAGSKKLNTQISICPRSESSDYQVRDRSEPGFCRERNRPQINESTKNDQIE
jgi:hypothetical protein